jgi:hypothetical protein
MGEKSEEILRDGRAERIVTHEITSTRIGISHTRKKKQRSSNARAINEPTRPAHIPCQRPISDASASDERRGEERND